MNATPSIMFPDSFFVHSAQDASSLNVPKTTWKTKPWSMCIYSKYENMHSNSALSFQTDQSSLHCRKASNILIMTTRFLLFIINC